MSVCLSLCKYVALFFENDWIFFSETLHMGFLRHCWGGHKHKKIISLTYLRGGEEIFWVIFAHFRLFLDILSWNFVEMFLLLLWWSLHTKNPRAWLSLAGVILGYFWAHFHLCSNVSWEMFNFSSWNFIQIFLVYILWQSTHYFFFSCLVLMEPILVYVPLFRENYSIFSHEILYRCF